MAIICWPMLRARRPGLRTSGSPLRYPTEPELPRYVRIEEQHKARSRKRAREDRVSAPAVQAEKPCGVCSRETTHLMVFTSGGAVHRPGWSRVNHRLAAAESVGAVVQSSSGLSKLTACGAASSIRLAACGPAVPVPQPAVPVSDSATCSIFHI